MYLSIGRGLESQYVSNIFRADGPMTQETGRAVPRHAFGFSGIWDPNPEHRNIPIYVIFRPSLILNGTKNWKKCQLGEVPVGGLVPIGG